MYTCEVLNTSNLYYSVTAQSSVQVQFVGGGGIAPRRDSRLKSDVLKIAHGGCSNCDLDTGSSGLFSTLTSGGEPHAYDRWFMQVYGTLDTYPSPPSPPAPTPLQPALAPGQVLFGNKQPTLSAAAQQRMDAALLVLDAVAAALQPTAAGGSTGTSGASASVEPALLGWTSQAWLILFGASMGERMQPCAVHA